MTCTCGELTAGNNCAIHPNRVSDPPASLSRQPFFTEEDQLKATDRTTGRVIDFDQANAKIQPVLDKLAQLERNHAPVLEENERLKADLENNIREKEEIVNNQDESRWAFWRKRAGELNDTRLQLEARIAKLEARREIRALRKVIDLAKEYHSEWDNPVPDAIQKKNCRDRLFRALADIEKEFAGE